MKNRLGLLVAAALLVAGTAACSVLAPAAALKTAAQPAQACMDALIQGKLTASAASGIGITGADGTQTAVEWPFGYTARNELGRIVLVNEKGKAVAKEGDEVVFGGGFGDRLWHACGPVEVTKAAT